MLVQQSELDDRMYICQQSSEQWMDGYEMHAPQRMNHNDFEDPLTITQVLP